MPMDDLFNMSSQNPKMQGQDVNRTSAKPSNNSALLNSAIKRRMAQNQQNAQVMPPQSMYSQNNLSSMNSQDRQY